MKRMLAVLTLLLLGNEAHAQGSWEWDVSRFAVDGTLVTGEFRVRNTQTEAINGSVFALSYFYVHLGAPFLGGGAYISGQSGPVLTAPLDAGPAWIGTGRNTLHYDPWWLSTASDAGGHLRQGGLEPSSGVGMLGCVIPMVWISMSYSGATCPGAGYDGWQVFSFVFHLYREEPYLDSRSISLQPYFLEIQGPNYSLLPEPSTYLMLAGGLGVLGLIAQRRRRQLN
jgi:hypothetical protein